MNLLGRINHQIKHRLVKPLASAYGLLAEESNEFSYLPQLEKNTFFELDNRPIDDQRESVFLNTGEDLTLTVNGLRDALVGIDLAGRKLLEVGPKYGIHSSWLDEKCQLEELVFNDFSKDSLIHDKWREKIKTPNQWVFGDARHLPRLYKGEQFDCILFLGVLYHTIYHLPILSGLNQVTKLGGKMLLESTVDSMPGSYLQVRWVKTMRAKAIPTLDALRVELAFAGWRKVKQFTSYRPGSSEVLLLCEKTDEINTPLHDTCEVVIPHK